MSTNRAGVWIDHRKAVVVVVGPAEEHTMQIVSNVEKHPERAGDSPLKGSYESRQVPPDDRRQMALTGELNSYYDAVIAAVRDAESLLIFGPGEAKGEFKKRLEKNKLDGRIALVTGAHRGLDIRHRIGDLGFRRGQNVQTVQPVVSKNAKLSRVERNQRDLVGIAE